MFERLDGLGATARGRRPKQVAGGGQERVRRDSFAGPDLPVRFSRISIASNQDSKDPWSQRSESSCDSSGHVAAPSPLTSSDFRQRADKDRSFTGSAPPGVRPPTKRGPGLFGTPANEEDEIGHDEPRRDSGSAPVTRPPPLVRARRSPAVPPALRGPIASQPTLNFRTVTPQWQYPPTQINHRLYFHPHPPPPPSAPAHPPHCSAPHPTLTLCISHRPRPLTVALSLRAHPKHKRPRAKLRRSP